MIRLRRRGWGRVSALAAAVAAAGLTAAAARGQVVERERDTTITGPRGRSIERKVEVDRGPNGVRREVDITRPGGTYRSDTTVLRRPPGGPIRGGGGGFGPGFRPGPPPPFFRGGRGPVVEEVFVGGPRPNGLLPLGLGLGLGGALGYAFGSATAAPPPPPPVYYAPPAVFVPGPPPPTVVYAQPQPYQGQPPPAVVVDPVQESIAKLSSHHGNIRREGVRALGTLGDPRAVPALIEKLKNDSDKDVRIASAWSLAQIGDPRGAVALERSATYDKKHDVRDAAAAAYARITRPVAVTPSASNAPQAESPNFPALDAPAGGNEPPPPPRPIRSEPAYPGGNP